MVISEPSLSGQPHIAIRFRYYVTCAKRRKADILLSNSRNALTSTCPLPVIAQPDAADVITANAQIRSNVPNLIGHST
jgi:hypothetical protein